jgi:hypothetical protein
MEKQSKPECVVEAVPEDPSRPDGPTDFYLVFDSRSIAKCGKPGTVRAMTWISQEPGVVVVHMSRKRVWMGNESRNRRHMREIMRFVEQNDHYYFQRCAFQYSRAASLAATGVLMIVLHFGA